MSTTDHEPTGVRTPGPVVRERPATAVTGAVGPVAGLLLLAGAVWAGFAVPDEEAGIALAVLVALLGALMLRGLITVASCEAKVLQFDRCTGTVRPAGAAPGQPALQPPQGLHAPEESSQSEPRERRPQGRRQRRQPDRDRRVRAHRTGAVGMVEMALERLSEREIVDLDEERNAAMVSNLLVVLCGDRATQPIINAGSLY